MKSMQRLGVRKRHAENAVSQPEANILNRQFHCTQPMEQIVADIYQWSTGSQRRFFIAYLDMFNNEIVAWNLGKRDDLSLVLPPLRQLLSQKEPNKPMLIHSEQGSQFVSYA